MISTFWFELLKEVAIYHVGGDRQAQVFGVVVQVV